jgi:hypothetical protein
LKPIFGQRRSDNASQFFEGIINSFKIYSDATFSTQIYGVDGGESWEDTIGSNNGTVVGTSTIVKIPALAAGINDTNGYPLNQPAGPWLYEGDETYVDFDVVENANQWLEQRWQGAEFEASLVSQIISTNALSGSDLNLSGLYTLNSNSGNQYYFDTRPVGFTPSAPVAFQRTGTRVEFNGDWYDFVQSLTTEYLFEFGYTSSSGDTTLSIDGVDLPISGGTGTSAGLAMSSPLSIGSRIDGNSSLEGSVRSISVTIDGAPDIKMPLLGTSLDLSSSVNHGTDTDITYNRLTDTSYTAGDVVEQPFSVSTTGNKVYDLVKFTFPVTT